MSTDTALFKFPQGLQQFVGATSTAQGIKPVKSASNPFSTGAFSSNTPKSGYHSEEDAVGQNKPYFSPRFLGYHKNQAVYGGSRLNVCC